MTDFRLGHLLGKAETAPPSFPRKRESSSFGFACFKFRVTSTSSFPRTHIPSFSRKWESSFLSFSHFQ
ncbi:hypothetical protein CIJ63_01825 [Neisseria meningitidis]|nr:hypothetical protein CIJ63_01825 [Neisseria meningitidis]RNK12005.1 hypothetical protein COI25_00155 [Neisseria meningitidis]RQL38797.1 hypothetical protein COH28_00205 [Neisseria meningitidis]